MFNRYFAGKHAWSNALNLEDGDHSRKQLRRMTDERITKAYAAIVSCAETIRDNPSSHKAAIRMEEIQLHLSCLRRLLIYASYRGKSQIADAERTAAYAVSLLPNPQGDGISQEITYYRVYIPTLDGNFFYLGLKEYAPGDIVVIPFGGENRIIYGIIREKFRREYWKMPLPLWKMKYIASNAPQEICAEYQLYLQIHGADGAGESDG